MKKQYIIILLLLSLSSNCPILTMRPATRLSRRAKFIRKTREKLKNKKERIDQAAQQDEKKCCTPKTVRTLIKIGLGIITLIKIIIKLSSN